MRKYKVSYVVPLYNKEAFIAECLNSLMKQTVKDIEIIVVNDCSTDDSLEIAKHMAKDDNRVKIITLNRNMGRSYARNSGIDVAFSDIIAVQDADDISRDIRTDCIIKAFKKDIDVFYSSFVYGNYIIPAVPIDINEIKKDMNIGIGHSTMAYRKSVIKKCGGYSNGKWSDLGLDDWKLQIDFIRAGVKFGLSSEPLMVYRTASNSISVTRNPEEVNKLKKDYLNEIHI